MCLSLCVCVLAFSAAHQEQHDLHGGLLYLPERGYAHKRTRAQTLPCAHTLTCAHAQARIAAAAHDAMEIAARHEKETSGLLARLRAAVKAGHSMYICMCKSSNGVTAGLCLGLAARLG